MIPDIYIKTALKKKRLQTHSKEEMTQNGGRKSPLPKPEKKQKKQKIKKNFLLWESPKKQIKRVQTFPFSNIIAILGKLSEFLISQIDL